jgi:hypothetical protein
MMAKMDKISSSESMKSGHQWLALIPSHCHLCFWTLLIEESFIGFCPFQLAHFAIEGLSLLGIVRLPFVNMLTIHGV